MGPSDLDVPGWPPEFAARYREAGYWTGATFPAMLAARAESHPDHVAVVDGDRRWTYAELDQRARSVAGGFRGLGIGRGDKVVVQLPNIGEYFEVIFALFRIGALPVFALPSHRLAELQHFCELTEAAAYVIPEVHDGFDYPALGDQVASVVPSLRHIIVVGDHPRCTSMKSLRAEVSADDPAVPKPSDLAFLQLSGGSTGAPKLIPRTHDDYFYSVRASAEICQLDEHTVYLIALPVAHNFPMSSPGSLGVFYVAGTVVLAANPAPDVVFELIERERVTMTAAVPPLALTWMAAAKNTTRDLSSLDVLQVGGAKFSAEAARRVQPDLGAQLQQVFGMAEGLVNYTRLDDPEDIVVGTQGRPISPDDEVLIVDDNDNELPLGATGHLLTRGPYTIRGYFKAQEHNKRAFTPDGFYRTGDVARLTVGGYLVVEGRAKDQINRGGEKIAAEEVENQLLAHEDVHDVAVVSTPDDFLGERTCAVVIPSAGQPKTKKLRLSVVKAFLRERGLAEYKLPDRLELVDEFPQTGVGKISKQDLRAAVAAMLAEKAATRSGD